MNKFLEEDILSFVHSFKLANNLKNNRFLITGATGLIGSILIHCLLALKENITIIAPLRDELKAKKLFDAAELQFIELVKCDLEYDDYSRLSTVDYIVHCAAPTSSLFFINNPVDTFRIIYSGTEKLLEYSRSKLRKSFVYLSSLEVYGTINDNDWISEETQGYLNPISIRSSYPMAKRAAESLCAMYASQYGVDVKIARLTQTTGAGIVPTDNRIIAQFCRLAAKGKDIILHTSGEASRPYCYTIDCVSAILYILLKGKKGEAYNVANEETYISAKDMAFLLKNEFNPSINITIENKENREYAPTTKLKLRVDKLKSLGWESNYNIRDILNRLVLYISSNISTE